MIRKALVEDYRIKASLLSKDVQFLSGSDCLLKGNDTSSSDTQITLH